MPKIVAYYRSSTDLQDSSVPTQQSEVRNYAIKHGMFLDDEYPDPATSARKLRLEDRPQMWRLVCDIQSGQIHTLLVYKRDRLARQAEEYLRIYEILREHNVNVIFTAENEFPMVYSPIGEFFELFMAGVIEREGDQIAERIRATKLSKFAEGNFATKSPYGYRNDKSASGKPFIRVESELRAVRRIFDLVLSGHYPKVSDVCKQLAAEGFTKAVSRKQPDNSRRVEQCPFEYGHITGIIQNPIYMGEQVMRFSGELKKKLYEGLGVVTYEEWFRAQDSLEFMVNRRDKTVVADTKEYVLSGLLWCEICKAKLEGKQRQQNWEKVHKYECPNHKEISIACDVVEDIIRTRVHDMLDGLMTVHFHKMVKRYIKQNAAKLETLMKSVESRIEEVEGKLTKRVRRLIHAENAAKKVKAENDIVELDRELNQHKQELNRLKAMRNKLDTTIPRAKNMKQQFAKIEEKMGTAELFKDLVRRIELGPHGLDIQLRHPFLEVGELLANEA